MQQATSGVRRGSRAAWVRGIGISIATLTALSACTAHSAGNSGGQSPAAQSTTTAGSTAQGTGSSSTPSTPAASTSTSTAPPKPAHISLQASSVTQLNPATPVSMSIANGRLTAVTMTNPAGKKVTGAISSDGTRWHNTEDLGYAKTYTIVARGANAAGKKVTKTAKVTTLSPDNQATPVLNTLDDYYNIDNGATYGVAMVPDIDFGVQVQNKLAVEKAITIDTSPHVAGAFYWSTDSQGGDEVHWRPQHYWKPGTQVAIHADVYGVQLSPGLYGGSDESISFKIGPDDRTVAYDTATNENDPATSDHVYVYRNGKLMRKMTTSMGKHGGVESGGQWINFFTLAGNYTVLDHENPAHMSSASYGLSVKDGGYNTLLVPYSTKISNDGIYLHQYNDTKYDQQHGNDVSEGCLNLLTADAAWYYNFSRVGDPVIVHGAKGAPTIQVWQGGDWSVPWKTWVKGNRTA